MSGNGNSTFCSVNYAFHCIGGKYKGRILWYLHEQKILRYGELKKILNGITTKMLTQTLRELEKDDLVQRKVYHEVPPKVEYSLTAAGEELIPSIHALRDWADRRNAIKPVENLVDVC
jgi:DNA-binding HxlR family transcriptional regulator